MVERFARTAAIVPRRNVVRTQAHDSIEYYESFAEPARAVRLYSVRCRESYETTLRRGSIALIGDR
ncbi:MAG: hypothetical protein NVS2B3_06010 [Vulcanimicrobiaceae bacterium]